MKYRKSIPWVAAAVLALALPAAPSAWAAVNAAAGAKLLSADLPQGVTLKRASYDQVGDALYTAATQHPEMDMSLLEAAILAKRPPPHHGDIPCPELIKMLKRTVAAVPDDARNLLELAISLDPPCTDALGDLLADPTLLGLPGSAFGNGVAGFGAGLGGNFPGAPGFTGSPPGGAVALPPPQPTPVTSVVNT